jgi:cyclophilin family peptidyl-prolyl cis-trans isomerase
MNKFLLKLIIFFLILTNQSISEENIMILKLNDGDVKIELYPDVAPNHVKRIKELADNGKYDNVVFHRVIDGFMAQTGDIQFGNTSSSDFNLNRAGTGGSDLPNLNQEFSNLPHDRGTLSMARSSDPNSANSQFFICFKPSPFLDNQYTVFGKVIEGMDFVDKIKRGDESKNGSVSDPDKIISFKSL